MYCTLFGGTLALFCFLVREGKKQIQATERSSKRSNQDGATSGNRELLFNAAMS